MAALDFFVKYIWFFMLLYAGYIGYDKYELKVQEKTAQEKLNSTIPDKILELEKELKKVKRFEENLAESQKRVEEVIKRIDTVQKQLPAEIDDAKVNNVLTQISEDLRMRGAAPSARGESNNGFYFSKEFNFDVEGTFLQGLILFERLDKLAKDGRILNVKYVRFSESENGDPRSRFKILKLNTVVEAFRYNPKYNPDGQ